MPSVSFSVPAVGATAPRPPRPRCLPRLRLPPAYGGSLRRPWKAAPSPAPRCAPEASRRVRDRDGSFALDLPAGDHRLTVSGPGIVEQRMTTIRAPEDAVKLDAIPMGGTWKLDFYREIARNGSGGGDLEPLMPWNAEPTFFIDTRPEPTTLTEIPQETIEFVKEAIRVTVPLLSGGRYRGERIEATPEPPADMTPGTVVLRWNAAEVADVAENAGAFAYRVGGSENVVVFRHLDQTWAVHHEIGHVMGSLPSAGRSAAVPYVVLGRAGAAALHRVGHLPRPGALLAAGGERGRGCGSGRIRDRRDRRGRDTCRRAGGVLLPRKGQAALTGLHARLSARAGSGRGGPPPDSRERTGATRRSPARSGFANTSGLSLRSCGVPPGKRAFRARRKRCRRSSSRRLAARTLLASRSVTIASTFPRARRAAAVRLWSTAPTVRSMSSNDETKASLASAKAATAAGSAARRLSAASSLAESSSKPMPSRSSTRSCDCVRIAT